MQKQQNADLKVEHPGYPVMLLASAGFWLVFVSLATTYAVFTTGYTYRLANLPLDLSLISLGTVFGLGLYAAVRRIISVSFPVQIAGLLALLIVCAILFQMLFGWMIVALGGKVLPPPTQQFVLSQSLFWLAPFGVWTALVLALLHNGVARTREKRLAIVEAQSQDAQLRALRYQVNPHFLYNTLNSIAALILDGQAAAAEQMVLRLAAFFRTSLANDPTSDVPVATEIALQRVYLDIEQVRFADRLEVRIDVADEVAGALVPNLILQPLVENALKHGCHRSDALTRISVSARRKGELLHLEVSDDGPGHSSHHGTGTGLANVRKRLEARFGSAAALATGPSPKGGFLASITLPLALP